MRPMDATLQAIEFERAIETAGLVTLSPVEADATAHAIRAVDAVIATRVAEVTRIAEALATAVQFEIIRGGEAAFVVQTAQAIEVTRAAQAAIAINNNKTAEAIKAIEANATAVAVAAEEEAKSDAATTGTAQAIEATAAAQIEATQKEWSIYRAAPSLWAVLTGKAKMMSIPSIPFLW
jgi:tryptophan 2,3-dioxygenase